MLFLAKCLAYSTEHTCNTRSASLERQFKSINTRHLKQNKNLMEKY